MNGTGSMIVQRDFVLLATLAAAAAMPAWGQTVAPEVGPASSATQTAASIPDFLRPVESSILARLRAAAIGSRPGGEQVAPEASFGCRRPAPAGCERPARRRRHRPAGWGLYQSDLEAPGSRNREEARRTRVKRRGCFDNEQSVLAAARAVHFLEYSYADAPAARQDHYLIHLGS